MAILATFQILKDKIIPARYPFFYRARRVRRPYVLTNQFIGNILMFNFRHLRPGWPFHKTPSNKSKREYKDFFQRVDPAKKYKGKTYDDLVSKSTPFVYKSPAAPEIVKVGNQIAIWLWDDLEAQKGGGKPYLYLQHTPQELSFSVPSQMKSLGIIGRNYPIYHYVGSEETLTFDISWYDYTTDQVDSVPVRCRKLEALSKTDGYSSGPRHIFIDWGDYDHYRDNEKSLLTNRKYLVQSADYKLSLFAFRRGVTYTGTPNKDGKLGLMVCTLY